MLSGRCILHLVGALCQMKGAEIAKAAALTMGNGSCRAHIPAMVHQTMAEVTAFLRRYQLPQRHFHLFGLFDIFHQPYPVHQTANNLYFDTQELPAVLSVSKYKTFVAVLWHV